MPFDARGTKIIKKADGKVVGHAKTAEAAKRAARVRNAVVYGRGTTTRRKSPARQSDSSY